MNGVMRACLWGWMMMLVGCGGKVPVGPEPDLELSSANSAARVAFDRGQVEEAANLYQRALMRARAMDDAAEIANAAYNTAACLVSLGQLDRAGELLAEAKSEMRRSGARIGDILSMQLRVAWLGGKTDEARAVANEIMSQSPPASAQERLQVHYFRGRIACDAGDAAGAAAELALARRELAGAPDPVSQARVAELSGRVERLANKHDRAAAEFDREASLLREGRLYGDMIHALSRAGSAYRDAGQHQRAGERFYRAGRSALGQGDRAEAAKLVGQAIDAAEEAGDARDAGRYRVLLNEVQGIAGPAPNPARRSEPYESWRGIVRTRWGARGVE